MRFVDPPTLDSPWRERPGDDLDDLMTAFFRSEMPSPWPGAPEPEEAEVIVRRRPPTRKPVWGSRLALAASVALLLAGGWRLSGSFQEPPNGGGPIGGVGPPSALKEKFPKFVPSIEHKPSGPSGLRIEVFLPEETQDGKTEKEIKGQIELPPE
jgi:hypothetical protein